MLRLSVLGHCPWGLSLLLGPHISQSRTLSGTWRPLDGGGPSRGGVGAPGMAPPRFQLPILAQCPPTPSCVLAFIKHWGPWRICPDVVLPLRDGEGTTWEGETRCPRSSFYRGCGGAQVLLFRGGSWCSAQSLGVTVLTRCWVPRARLHQLHAEPGRGWGWLSLTLLSVHILIRRVFIKHVDSAIDRQLCAR